MYSSRRILSLLPAVFTAFWACASAAGLIWTPCANAPTNKQWQAIASSANGSKLVAASWGGGIYTSADSGRTWVSNNVPPQTYYDVASSADGASLVATVYNVSPGAVWASKDSGTNWYVTGAPTGGWQNYMGVASSADGMKLAAAGAYAPSRYIYTSSNGGTNWFPSSASTARSWYDVVCSADGTKLFGVAWNYPSNFTSADSGATWISHPVPTNYWYAAASSADGSNLVEIAHGGGVFTSTNAGATWYSNAVPNVLWTAVASSSDGAKIAVAGDSALYTSVDSGQTWISNDIPMISWSGIASSADGRKLVAVAYSGEIYTAAPAPPSLGVALTSTTLALTWPAAETNFFLQQSLDLSSWTDLTNAPSLHNGQNEVILPAGTDNIFYRLKGR